jgi:3-hydroxybutyrate dehydrogenase
VAQLGGIDILVNNAGIQHTAPVEEFPPEKWDAIIAVNLSSSFHTIHHSLPHMKASGWGRIINIASVHGLVASVNKAAYVTAKHGLVGLTRVVALETAGLGITCNAICPGWTRTELIEPQIVARAQALGVDIETGGRDLLAEKQPSRQFVSIEQLGQLALFLCSDAAAQITGAPLPIDGGWTAQ